MLNSKINKKYSIESNYITIEWIDFNNLYLNFEKVIILLSQLSKNVWIFGIPFNFSINCL